MDWRGLLKDKRAQAFAAVGAVAGLVVLVRRGGSAEASDTPAAITPTAGGGGAGGGYLGAYDSSGTDAYNNIQTSVDNQLGEFRNTINDLSEQLAALGTKGSKPSTPAPKPGTKPKPTKPKPAPKPAPGRPAPKPRPTPGKQLPTPKPRTPAPSRRVISIRRGDTLSGLAKQYKTTVPALMRLNPSIKNQNRIQAGASLRVR